MNERPNDPTVERAQVERGEIGREETDDAFLPDERMSEWRSRWNDVQAEFVDDPRRAVGDAQRLVRTVVDELTETF